MALEIIRIIFYIALLISIIIFVKLNNIEINGKKIIKLRYRILISIFFPLVLFIIFLVSSLIIALIFIIFLIIFLIFLFSSIKIRYRRI